MPTVYINGDAPDYPGFEFTTTQGLLEKIRDELGNAGWATHSDDIAGSSKVVMKATDNGHNAYVEFRSVIASGNSYTLRIRGDLLGNGASLSSDTIQITYETTKRNYLYLTADSAGGCLGIFNATTALSDSVNAMKSCHFGFLDRYDNTDQWAWMVGHLWGQDYQYAFAAKSKFNDTIWRQLSADYNNSTTYSSSTYVQPAQSTWDRYTICAVGDNVLTTSQSTNASHLAHQGRLNSDSLPVLGEYFYVEGRGSTTAYPGQLFFRGVVRFAVVGFAASNSGVIALGVNNRRYISGGGIGWQGFVITA